MKTTALITALLATAAMAAPAAADAAPKKSKRPTAAASTPAKALAKLRTRVPGGRLNPSTQRRWSYDGTVNRPGAITAVSPIQAVTTTVWAGQTVGYISQLTVMNAEGPTVQRSPASTGLQGVIVLYATQVWNGRAWVNHQVHSRVATIPAGYGATRTPAYVNYPKGLRGAVRVIIGIFQYADGGALLGASVIVPNTAADQSCHGGARCATRNGYLVFS